MKPNCALCAASKACACLADRARGKIHRQRRVGAVVADVQRRPPADAVLRHALLAELGEHGIGERRDGGVDRLADCFGKRPDEALLARGENARHADAVGRQQAGEGVDQHRLHAERVGHQAGMLAAGAAEAVEQIAGHVVAALHRNLLDGVRHVLDGDGDETFGDGFGRTPVADLGGKSCEFLVHDIGVQRLVLSRPENRREEIRLQLAEHDVGVGDRERAAAAVTGRAGIGAGRIRADAKTSGLEMQDRAAARRDRVDAHHRRAHAHAGDLRVEGALVFAVIVGDVGRGAAHVEADHLVEARKFCRLHHADHAAGRTGQQRVLALEHVGGGEPSRGHHEHQAGRLLTLPLVAASAEGGQAGRRRVGRWRDRSVLRRRRALRHDPHPVRLRRRSSPQGGGCRSSPSSPATWLT